MNKIIIEAEQAEIAVGDTVEVQCEHSYRAEVMSIRGEEATIKVLDNPAKGSWTGAPLSVLKKIEVDQCIDCCSHGYDIACPICVFGTWDGQPAVVIKSVPSDPLELLQTRRDASQGLGTPHEFITGGHTGGDFKLPFTNKTEWEKAFAKAWNFDPNSMRRSDWPADWPTDANFYRINVNTPIFYKYESGEIKRWIKYAKCWVDSCITDWYAFSRQNAVQGLRSWPSDKVSITLLDEYRHRDDLDMIHVRGEFSVKTDPVNLTDQIVINAMSYCVRSSSQIYRLINEAGHAVTPLALRIHLDSLVDRKLAETKRDLLSREKVWRLLEQAQTNNNSDSNGLENKNG